MVALQCDVELSWVRIILSVSNNHLTCSDPDIIGNQFEEGEVIGE